MKKLKKVSIIVLGFSLIIIVGLMGFLYFQFKNIQADIIQEDDGLNRPSVLQYANQSVPKKPAYSLAKYNFSLSHFPNPELKYGPYTRWWWPGNDVDSLQIRREIQKFFQIGIAGIEIQPFTTGLNPKTDSARKQRVNSWNTESYFKNLKVALDEAEKNGMTVDLNSVGGWPTGGTQIAIEDNFKTILYSEKSVEGRQKINEKIAYPKAPFSSYFPAIVGKLAKIDLKGGKMYMKYAKLESVSAYKVIKNQRSNNVFNLTNQVTLDLNSAVVLDAFVKNNTLIWDVPQGDWHIIGFWSLPADEQPIFTPVNEKPYVVDHFDSTKVKANYNYLFGKRADLDKYFGKPLRAIFNDSYEFTMDRHFTTDFFEFFKQKRGYDIRPFLPANMIPTYNYAYAHATSIKSQSAFKFGSEDWRLVHDYDLTISELLENHFFKSSKNWLNQRGMLHRTQAYGMPMDNIKAAAFVDIPEAEHLYGEFSYAFLKLVSSGAFLYNRPLTTSESIVFEGREYMTSPLKAKAVLDKSFSNGVNQTIYHGTSYPYFNEDYSEFGWFPWSSPYLALGFSFDYRQSNTAIWKYMPAINQYVRLTQYALQSGKPKKDVLVYFPFMGIGYQKDITDEKEILKGGYFEGYEPKTIRKRVGIPFMSDLTSKSENITWLKKVYPTLNKIEEAGLDWSWVNNHSILEATTQNGLINIRGNLIEKIILPYIPYLPLEVMQKLNELANQGANIVFVGETPGKQPSFKDYQKNDLAIQQLIKSGIESKKINYSKVVDNQVLVSNTIGGFRTSNADVSFTKRIMADGSVLVFYANKTNKMVKLNLNPNTNFKNNYLLNSFTGEILKFDGQNFELEGFESRLVFYDKNGVGQYPNLGAKPIVSKTINLNQWNISVANQKFTNAKLFNWITNEKTKFAATGTYETTFKITEIPKKIELKIGDFAHAATVYVNGKQADLLSLPPYQLDISKYLKVGENQLKIAVDVPLRNYFIGEYLKGDKHYTQFKGKEDVLMNTGLAGKISLLIY